MVIPSGMKTLIQLLSALEALHSQILNVPDPNHQKVEQYGVLVPRWAVAEDTPEAEAREAMVFAVRRRAMQSVPVKDAIKVVREIIKEHGLSQDVPASELGGQGGGHE